MAGNRIGPAEKLLTVHLILDGKETQGHAAKRHGISKASIQQYCIAHDHNYSETASKFRVSYQQARNYTVKYETGGVDALQDRRGRTKPVEEMTELEKLRAENKLLRAGKERAEMEVSFLKNSTR